MEAHQPLLNRLLHAPIGSHPLFTGAWVARVTHYGKSDTSPVSWQRSVILRSGATLYPVPFVPGPKDQGPVGPGQVLTALGPLAC